MLSASLCEQHPFQQYEVGSARLHYEIMMSPC